MTQIGYYATFGFPVYQPNTYLTPGYQGTLGCGYCIALGAKVGRPDVPVVSVNGDGGFGFTMNELATMAQHNIGVVTLVFNDGAYGNVRRMQRYDYGEKIIASDLVNPDFMKLADAFGVAGRRATLPERAPSRPARGDQSRRADPDRDPGPGDAEPLEATRPAVANDRRGPLPALPQRWGREHDRWTL